MPTKKTSVANKGLRCPKCGSSKVQLTTERSRHGFLWFLVFGFFYAIWWMFKVAAAVSVALCYDSWRSVLAKRDDKGYVWVSKRIMQNVTRNFYCHNCGHNFRG